MRKSTLVPNVSPSGPPIPVTHSGGGNMDGLAAVEDDVERKRVGKNPFDEKFTSLVRILRDSKWSSDYYHSDED